MLSFGVFCRVFVVDSETKKYRQTKKRNKPQSFKVAHEPVDDERPLDDGLDVLSQPASKKINLNKQHTIQIFIALGWVNGCQALLLSAGIKFPHRTIMMCC